MGYNRMFVQARNLVAHASGLYHTHYSLPLKRPLEEELTAVAEPLSKARYKQIAPLSMQRVVQVSKMSTKSGVLLNA
jgi:hypothetical protein